MKTRTVGAFAAKTHLSSLLDQVEQGNVVFITRHGRTIAELRPVSPERQPRFGAARGKGFKLSVDFDESLADFAEYER